MDEERSVNFCRIVIVELTRRGEFVVEKWKFDFRRSVCYRDEESEGRLGKVRPRLVLSRKSDYFDYWRHFFEMRRK